MTIAVEVFRGDGDHRGDDVVDALIGSVPCAISRGRNEMDSRAHRRTKVEIAMIFRPGVRVGQLVRVVDASGVWTGKIVRIVHKMDNAKTLTTLTVDRPLLLETGP